MSALACFTFDNMGEAADVGAGAAYRPDVAHDSIAVGYPRIFALLERQKVRASFFVEGWNGKHHAGTVAEIVERGHELGMHGWTHEAWAELEPRREEELARRSTEALERAAGVRPRGFRAPGGARSAATERILAALGYDYDASLGDGMRSARLASGLAQVPFVWPGVDGFHYLRQPPADADVVRDTWLRALEKAAAQGGLFLLVCHAFLTGTDPRRLEALEAVMSAAVADARLEVVTAGEIARRVSSS